ncbi:inner centromere protein [Calypte anna]|uniref:inner centromere protein n=1 Tax=Calypte anna TaxID=9244 RepID=UPI0011C34CD8|nr:inner centromere protein [Calypte anna]
MAAAGPAALPALCSRRLGEFLRQVDDTDLLWLEEIREEAARMFSSHYSDEPELMPKTPSQKNRQRRKRLSVLQEESQEPGRKRLSRRRNSSARRASQRLRNKETLELIRAEVKQVSPPRRVTRSQAAASAEVPGLLPKPLAAPQHLPCVKINASDCASAELYLQKSTAEEPSIPILSSSDDDSPQETGVAKSPPVPTAPELLVPSTPQADNRAGSSKAAPKLEAAQAVNTTFILSEESGLEGAGGPAEVEEVSVVEPPQPLRDNPPTPTGSRRSRRSVRRSLMGKTSLTHRTSLAEKYSLASKRESMTRKSITRATAKRRTAHQSSVASSSVDASSSGEVAEEEETVLRPGLPPGPCTPSKQNPQSPRLSLRSPTVSRNEQQQETDNNESNSKKSGETQEPPQSARRKPSYKRAVDERYDNQQAEEGGLSPLRRKTPSPTFPASKVVRPFKTFLHTVQKNQLLMTPSSVGRNGVIKSFIRYNTPLQSDPKEKERQKLETLRKKQEAEQLRKQKLEEEKKRRLEEARLKREERLLKVLQARERAEQIEEERKRRIERKIALFDEKTEKVREERLAEEKIRKRAAAKKMEEAEARRRQDEEARKLKALQQEEEERRHKELMLKRKEEEQERARKIAEQRQAEQEREKQLAAERELERKREKERIQAERLREQQENAARLQKEVLAAKGQLHKEMEKKENSPAVTSYQMTPQAQKAPKLPIINPNNYGMDLNSDDSTDDESHPRKPIPAWATGHLLIQAVARQYHKPPNVDALFGVIPSPKLEDIFYKSKPRYFKRTSSAVWSSPPFPAAKVVLGLPCGPKMY